MVKGVNKKIIEVNETGSDIFEKIVFYVSPKYSSLEAKALQKAAFDIGSSLCDEDSHSQSLRLRFRRKLIKNKITFAVLSLLLLGVISTAAYFLFL